MITKMGVPFNGLAGAGFSGSYKGMRFFMKTYDKENISVFVYPEPYNFENKVLFLYIALLAIKKSSLPLKTSDEDISLRISSLVLSNLGQQVSQ